MFKKDLRYLFERVTEKVRKQKEKTSIQQFISHMAAMAIYMMPALQTMALSTTPQLQTPKYFLKSFLGFLVYIRCLKTNWK